MKSYLSAFLLFLLLLKLVDKSISSRVPPSSTKVIFKKIGENSLDNAKQKFSPQQPNSPPKQIEGLSFFKGYLSNFGYLQSSEPFNDYLDEETITAIKTYQQYFNLQPTGNINNETLHQILLPRCAVPDMNFYYNFTDLKSWPKAGNQWFPMGKSLLTYGFQPMNEMTAEMKKVFTDAFTRWVRATAGVLKLTETTYDNADIKVGFYRFDGRFKNLLFGGSVIRYQPDSNVTTGDIRLDLTDLWALPREEDMLSQDGVLDLESAAMHQIGHLLGLDHSNKEDSVMYPYMLPSQKRKVKDKCID